MPVFAFEDEDTNFSSVDALTVSPRLNNDNVSTLDPPELPTFPLSSTEEVSTIKANVSRTSESSKITQCQKQTDEDCPKLKIRLLDFIASGYSLPGENVEGLLSDDLKWNGVTVFPKGSKIHGEIIESAAENNKTHQKPSLSLRLQDLVLPNTDLPQSPDIEGDYQQRVDLNIYWAAPKSYLGNFTREMASALKGGLKGAYKGGSSALAMGGMQTAFLTHGVSVVGGSLVGAIWHGSKAFNEAHRAVILPEGTVITVAVSPQLLSSAVSAENLPKLAITNLDASPIKITVQHATLGADPFAVNNQLTVGFDLNNTLPKELSSFHLALIDNFGERYYLSPFAASEGYKTKFPAYQTSHAEMTFTIKSNAANYYLVVFSPDKNQKIIYKQPVVIN